MAPVAVASQSSLWEQRRICCMMGPAALAGAPAGAGLGSKSPPAAGPCICTSRLRNCQISAGKRRDCKYPLLRSLFPIIKVIYTIHAIPLNMYCFYESHLVFRQYYSKGLYLVLTFSCVISTLISNYHISCQYVIRGKYRAFFMGI